MLLALWLYATASQANTTCKAQKTDFVASSEAGLSASAIAAAPLIEILDRDGRRLDACSSAVLSSQGTLLTAGHCIEACLQGATTFQDGVTRVVAEQMNRNGCQVRMNGVTSTMKILATNDCRGEERWAALSGKCSGLDYAILKVDEGLMGDRPCFNPATRPPAPGTLVGSMGYPVESGRRFLRRGAKDSTGVGQFFSDGQTLAFQDHCTPKTDAKATKMTFPGDERNAALKAQVDSGAYIQTAGAEFLKRGSGGPLVDMQTFDVTGIAAFYINNTDVVECSGSTFYSSVAAIVHEAKTKFPTENWENRLDCKKAIGRGLPFRAVPL